MKLALTGAGGFLGWHTRLLAFAEGIDEPKRIKLGDEFDPVQAADALNGVERLIHIAGVNRASDDESIEQGNIRFAEQLSGVLSVVEEPPGVVIFANSIQSDLDNPYGRGKRTAGELLTAVCQQRGIDFVDLKLPNLFGAEGRPFYNSVVSTFAHQVAQGETPKVLQDRSLQLMHAQEAARLLIRATSASDLGSATVTEATVASIASHFTEFHKKYSLGEIPDISSSLRRDLFNAYRAAYFEGHPELVLRPHSDARGSLVETLKSYGGEGQTFFSTTRPGVTRGDHFHLRKVERFVVLSGTARIRLRKMFSERIIDMDVSGSRPTAIDMPIGWVHNITNTGDSELLTQFWTNEVFNPNDTDTFYEKV